MSKLDHPARVGECLDDKNGGGGVVVHARMKEMELKNNTILNTVSPWILPRSLF